MKIRSRIIVKWGDDWVDCYMKDVVHPQALMLREPLMRWVGSLITGEVTIQLSRR